MDMLVKFCLTQKLLNASLYACLDLNMSIKLTIEGDAWKVILEDLLNVLNSTFQARSLIRL